MIKLPSDCEHCAKEDVCRIKQDFIYAYGQIMTSDTAVGSPGSGDVFYAKDNPNISVTVTCTKFLRKQDFTLSTKRDSGIGSFLND